MRSIALLVVALTVVLPASRSRADEAAVRRLATAVAAVKRAPQPLPAVVRELRGLEGIHIVEQDVAALRRLHAGAPAELGPLLDAVRELSMRSGAVRLVLARPVVLAPLDGERGALALASEASFVVRAVEGGAVALEDVRGVRVGYSAGITLELRRLTFASEGGRSVARAEVRLGIMRKTLTLDLGPSGPGLAGVVRR